MWSPLIPEGCGEPSLTGACLAQRLDPDVINKIEKNVNGFINNIYFSEYIEKTISEWNLEIEPEDIFPAFKHAYEREDSKPTLMIEYSEYYGTK